MSTSDDNKVSEDRREALRYALTIGSGAALASTLASPASAQTNADNTLDRIRANKVLRIAVLPGELPYFNKDLATGTWSGFSIEMANDIAKLLDAFERLLRNGGSILIIEHNMEVIRHADWVIDLGPEGGSGGGRIVAEGTPEQIAKVKESYTGHYLAQ